MRNTTAKKVEQCRMFFVDGKKFKTNALLGFFRVPLRRENATKLALLAEVLQKGTEKYPSVTAVAAAAEECYGALWQVQIIKKGGEAWLSFSMEVSKHVSEKEVLDFLLQLMKHPKRIDNQFPAETVERCKVILRRRLEAQGDDKISFAAKRARELAAEGESAGVCADGYLEDLEKLTAADISSFYEDLLAHAPVYLYVCGDSDGRQMLKKWKGALDLQGKLPGNRLFAAKSPKKPIWDRLGWYWLLIPVCILGTEPFFLCGCFVKCWAAAMGCCFRKFGKNRDYATIFP